MRLYIVGDDIFQDKRANSIQNERKKKKKVFDAGVWLSFLFVSCF